MNRYDIRKVFLWPVFKFGAAIGVVLMLVPAITLGLLVRFFVRALHSFAEGMGWLTLSNPDMVTFAQQVATLDKMGALLIVWTALGTFVVGSLLYGLGAAIAALLYNLIAKRSGGVMVEVEQLPATAITPMPAPAPAALPQPRPAPAAPAALPQPQPAPVAQVAVPDLPQVAQPVASPMSAPAGPWLAVGTPPQRWPVRSDRTRLGSAPDNDIVLPGINPYHAEIRFEDGLHILYDMAAGQTWVNGRPVAGRNMLKEGFVIRLAGQEMVFHAT